MGVVRQDSLGAILRVGPLVSRPAALAPAFPGGALAPGEVATALRATEIRPTLRSGCLSGLPALSLRLLALSPRSLAVSLPLLASPVPPGLPAALAPGPVLALGAVLVPGSLLALVAPPVVLLAALVPGSPALAAARSIAALSIAGLLPAARSIAALLATPPVGILLIGAAPGTLWPAAVLAGILVLGPGPGLGRLPAAARLVPAALLLGPALAPLLLAATALAATQAAAGTLLAPAGASGALALAEAALLGAAALAEAAVSLATGVFLGPAALLPPIGHAAGLALVGAPSRGLLLCRLLGPAARAAPGADLLAVLLVAARRLGPPALRAVQRLLGALTLRVLLALAGSAVRDAGLGARTLPPVDAAGASALLAATCLLAATATVAPGLVVGLLAPGAALVLGGEGRVVPAGRLVALPRAGLLVAGLLVTGLLVAGLLAAPLLLAARVEAALATALLAPLAVLLPSSVPVASLFVPVLGSVVMVRHNRSCPGCASARSAGGSPERSIPVETDRLTRITVPTVQARTVG